MPSKRRETVKISFWSCLRGVSEQVWGGEEEGARLGFGIDPRERVLVSVQDLQDLQRRDGVREAQKREVGKDLDDLIGS